MDISQFLREDELVTLRDSFLVSWRGMPIVPYPVPCTKRLLIQLKTVCDEKKGRYGNLFVWFCQLFPEAKVDQMRFVNQVKRALTTAERIFTKNGEDALRVFLDSPHDVNFIADELSAIGITSKELEEDPQLLKALSNDILLNTGAVLQLESYRDRKKLRFSVIVTWLNNLLSASYSELYLSEILKRLCKESAAKRKHSKKEPLELQNFLAAPFRESLVSSETSVNFIADELSAIGITSKELEEDPQLLKALSNDILLTTGAVLQLESYRVRKRLRFSVIVTWLNNLLSDSYSELYLSENLKCLCKESAAKRKNSKKEPLELQNFLAAPFRESLVFSETYAKVITEHQQSLKDCQEEISGLNQKLQAVTEQYKVASDMVSSLNLKLLAVSEQFEVASQKVTSLQRENAQLENLNTSLNEESNKLAELVESHERVAKKARLS